MKKLFLLAWVTVVCSLYACSSPVQTQTPTLITFPTPIQVNEVVASTQTVLEEPTATATTQATVVVPTDDPVVTQEPQAPQEHDSIFGTLMVQANNAGGLDKMAEAGSSWVPLDYSWKELEPVEGYRNWTSPGLQHREQEFLRVSGLGMRTLFIFDFTPEWALKPGFACGAVDEDSLQAMGNAAYDIVKRFSQQPYNIHTYQISNEPDAAGAIGCWGDPTKRYYGGEYFGEMLKVVTPRIREADPQAQVVIGGLLLDCSPIYTPERCQGENSYKAASSLFLEGILISGAKDYFDGVAFHAYDYFQNFPARYTNPNWYADSEINGPVQTIKAKFLRETLAKYNASDKFLMNTEVALLCGKDGSEPVCLSAEYQNVKAAYLTQTFTLSVVEQYQAEIWFYTIGGWRASGLLDHALNPTPAYYAFQFVEEMIGTATYVRPVDSNNPNVHAYEFENQGKIIWVLWALGSETYTITLPGFPEAIYDKLGNSIPAQLSFNVNFDPIFIVFP